MKARRFKHAAVVGLALVGGGGWRASSPVSAGTVEVLEEIIIVYKTHFDIGYSALAREVVHEYRTEMIDRSMAVVDENRAMPEDQQFVWTIPGWPMEQMLWEGQAPERRERIEKALRDGHLTVHALPFTTHTETLEMEDLVRGLGHASRVARAYGLPLPRGAKMTDVPCHSWFLPTLLSHAGVEFFHFGCNITNAFPTLPPLFWWEGPDGSRLLTMASHGYGTTRLPPRGWPHKIWLYISQTGDNAGPPGPERVREDIAFYRQHAPNARVRIGRLEDFADALLAEEPDLPVIRSDLPDTWIHGVMTLPEGSRIAHNTRPSISAAESLRSLERCWGLHLSEQHAKDLLKAHELSLLFGEHTWGLATQHYLAQPYGQAWEDLLRRGEPVNVELLNESWAEHEAYIREARRLTEAVYYNAVATLADHTSGPARRIVVYNPLPWKRDGMVQFNSCYWPGFRSVRALDGEMPVPVEVTGKVVRFVASDVPSMGYRTFVTDSRPAAPASLVADAERRTVESPFFKASVDPVEGRIVSLVDKRTGRELVDSGAALGFGQYFYERFGKKEVMDRFLAKYVLRRYAGSHDLITGKSNMPDAPYASAAAKNTKLDIKKTSVEVTAILSGMIPGPGMPQTVRMRLTLYRDLPAADIEVTFEKKPDGWPEAGWICLPLNIEEPTFRLGRLGADLDPVKDITVDNVNYHQMWVNTGVAVYGKDGFGVGICPLDSPLVSLGKPGSHWFSRRYEPETAHVFLNLYNNQWQTNFSSWVGGRHTSRARIWTFDAFDSGASLYSPAMEARVPLRCETSSCQGGKLPPVRSGLALSRKGVMVTAFADNPDGEGTLLRLWEQGGLSSEAIVRLPKGCAATRATPVNLRGETVGEPLQIIDGKLRVQLRRYAPSSFILSP